jgi:polysaccharide export outer membrane protein
MPVRSRGSLLAGTATLAGLIVAGLGCHSSYSDHDSFSIPNTPPTQPVGSLLSRRGNPAMQAGYPAQPVVTYAPVQVSNPTSRPVTLQPVPMTQTPVKREVIASSWSPVQRVSAEQLAPGPDLPGGTPITHASNYQSSPPIAFSPSAPMPMGSPMPAGNGPVLDGGDAVSSGSIILPPPRPLGSSAPVAVVHDGGHGPSASPYPNVPREFEKMALPPYVVEPPDILLIQASPRITLALQQIQGQHLVAPDGTVNLGVYGKVRVAGLTLDQVADAVAARLLEIMPGLLRDVPEFDKEGKEKPDTKGKLVDEFRKDYSSLDLIKKELQVDVLVYSSKFYYVITDGGGYGQQVYPIPVRGNETVLDALANINGLPAVASKKRVWVARATRAGQAPKILPVDWQGITKCGSGETNYQLFPGDRVYVDSNNLIKADSFLAKLYSPILRTFGVTLLGASTVNTIKLGTTSGVGAGGLGAIR